MLRPELLLVGRALLAVDASELSLDHVGDAIGTLRVTPDELDALFDWLEAQGRSIGDPVGQPAAALLGEVLAVARSLRTELDRAPHPREIAERSSLSIAAVQRALWFARVLSR